MASKVAIVDDSVQGRVLLSSLFAAGHYDVMSCSSDDMETLSSANPDIVVIGACVQQADDMFERLRSKDRKRFTPCIALLKAPTPDARLRMISKGVRDVLAADSPDALLLARARSVLREAEVFRELERRRQATLKFGFAEDGAAFAVAKTVVWVGGRGKADRLPDLGYTTSWSLVDLSISDVLAPRETRQGPAGYILDWRKSAAGTAARNTLPELRARGHSRHSAILVIHDAADCEAAVQALDAGASEVVPNNVDGREIGLRVSRMLKAKAAEDALRKNSEDSLQLAVTDPLTGLYNRRYAEAYLADLAVNREPERPIAVMIADIDRFKSINDTYGHSAGDEVLQDVSKRLKSEMRATDLVARFGGEEFLIVLAESDLKQAKRAANRLRQRIGHPPIELQDGRTIDVTISVGVSLGDIRSIKSEAMSDATVALGLGTISDLMACADSALYRAKKAGRNRVRLASTSGGTS